MNTLWPVTSHQRRSTHCCMHRWLQLAPVDESCFLSKFCYSRTCNSKTWGGTPQQPFGRQYVSEEVILARFYVFSTLVDFSFDFLDFSQRVFLHSSQGRSCLRLLRHSSLLSGLGGCRRSGVMRRQRTCYVNLGGKSLNIFGKMPLYTLSHPLFFFGFSHLTVRILQSYRVLMLKGPVHPNYKEKQNTYLFLVVLSH